MIEIFHVQNEQLRTAYDDLYDQRPIRHLDSFYRWIFSLLKVNPGQLYLDVATGQARLVELASENGAHAFGTDMSFSALHASKMHVKLFVANGENIPIRSGSLDLLSCIGSLEHYSDPARGMREIARLLKPDGLACIFVPNTFGITATVLYALHTGEIADDGQPIQRYNTHKGWQRLLEANGLQVVATKKYEREWPRSFLDFLAYCKHPKELLHLAISPFIPLNLSNSFTFLCRRKN